MVALHQRRFFHKELHISKQCGNFHCKICLKIMLPQKLIFCSTYRNREHFLPNKYSFRHGNGVLSCRNSWSHVVRQNHFHRHNCQGAPVKYPEHRVFVSPRLSRILQEGHHSSVPFYIWLHCACKGISVRAGCVNMRLRIVVSLGTNLVRHFPSQDASSCMQIQPLGKQRLVPK